MNKSRIGSLALLVAALAAGGYFYKQKQVEKVDGKLNEQQAANGKTPGGARPQTAPAATPAPVAIELKSSELYKLEPSDFARQVPITGSLRATNQTLVKSKVAGELVEISVREGMLVKAGSQVARIDSIEFDLRVKEREALLRSAQAQLEQANRTLETNKQLLDKNFISQNVYDNSKSTQEVSAANLDAARSQLAQAKKSLADTRVLAPMSGTVAERFAQPGEKVSPDNRILSIVDLSRMELEAAVPASDVGSVQVGQNINLSIEGVEKNVQGRVLRISPSTAAGTRSVPVYIGIQTQDPRVRTGLFAQGALALDARKGVLLVPTGAVREIAGRNFVYLVEGGKVNERDVKLGARDESRATASGVGVIEVLSGLKAGEQIVGVNLGSLRVGSPVSLKP